MAELTREHMIKIIEGGASVMLNSGSACRIVTRIQDLPSVAEFARKSGDPAKVQSAREELEAKIKALQADRDVLDAGAIPHLEAHGESPLIAAARARALALN
jgi:hypothetical protein